MSSYVVLLYGNASLRSLSLRRLSPPPPETKDLTSGPWRSNLPDGAQQTVHRDFPSTARFQSPVDLDDRGSGARWELRVQIQSSQPSELNAVVFEESSGTVVAKLRPRLSAKGQLTRAGDFTL